VEVDPDLSEAQLRQRAGLSLTRDMGSHAIATVWAVAGEMRDRLEQPVLGSPGWAVEIAQQSSGMLQSLAHDVDEAGIAATAGNLAVGMAIAMTPMLPEAMAVVSSGGEDSGAIVGLMFAVLETVAMGAARQPGGAAGAGSATVRSGARPPNNRVTRRTNVTTSQETVRVAACSAPRSVRRWWPSQKTRWVHSPASCWVTKIEPAPRIGTGRRSRPKAGDDPPKSRKAAVGLPKTPWIPAAQLREATRQRWSRTAGICSS
jgi:hypothetical protein